MLQLDSLLAIFASTLLPVFLVALAGYILSSFVALDGRTLGRFLFFLATPSLVFRSLYEMSIDLVALQHIAVVTIGVMLVGVVLSLAAAWGQDRRRRAGLVLAGAIGNNGNMGIPICFFAFGEAGVALATVYYAMSSFLSNTVGVVIASAGGSTMAGALLHSLQSPVLYAAFLGLALNQVHVTIPGPLFNAIELLAGAAVPGMLVLLGTQLRSTRFGGDQRIVWRSALIRLVASPVAAWLLCNWMGVGGLERQVLIVQAAMPTAVMTTVLATEFDASPGLVAAAVLATSLLSMVTLSIVLSLVL
jgi:predicted permease